MMKLPQILQRAAHEFPDQPGMTFEDETRTWQEILQRCEQLAGLNHLFQETETGLPTEYSAIEETFSPRALTMISEWVQSH